VNNTEYYEDPNYATLQHSLKLHLFPQYVNTKIRPFCSKFEGVLKHKLTTAKLCPSNLPTVTVTAALRGVRLPQYD
jgi:hypothetical protein